ncbi:tyrosine-protein phosphatase non-receptor type 3 isoform X2 [Denticeps clupeoides]|uniref:tyrosine-protein phosphatase non-receptor type 3 isoform X2 n=1 Tax=Denticeps clupeoides TaxID=299321 RepID=UPI0010A2DF19|nr:tyrosine-protein phosphatase non-receptor type 3 isoform X2 [Denticeps clupeoides]
MLSSGDYTSGSPPGYLSNARFLPEQNVDFLSKVEALHPQHRGLSKCEAELCFLNTARTLELYGVELHVAKDVGKSALSVGIASGGVALFCNLICTNFFPWINIVKISFKNKTLSIHVRRKHGEEGEQVVAVNTLSSRSCKNLWKSCVDHHSFYLRKNTPASPTNRPLYRKLVGGKLWESAVKSVSTEHLETRSLPSRSPPNTPNWRSTRLRQDVHKPRPSSVDNLVNEMSDGTESEEVFYTYRKSLDDGKTNVSHADDMAGNESTGDKSVTIDGDLLLVKFSPDSDGKFGFNVKGGSDQKTPLVISHVHPDSPAAQCTPAVCVGDELVLVNGRDVSEHTHQQVVMFIKASRETHTNQLTLLLRRRGVLLRPASSLKFDFNLSLLGDVPLPASQLSGQSLEESMTHLERGVSTGTLLLQFEKLYRKKPGLSLMCAKMPENIEKNRYKDVLPYDSTRVVLNEEDEDYINASHVKTEPAGSVLRYIATQGPLGHTCTDFWRCVWEQKVAHIIMLTTLTERGRTKCHQYWPHTPETKDYGYLQVCCHSEEGNLTYVRRELTLTNTRTGEGRGLTHLQYVAWPDHGPPDDASDFLDFVQSVRSLMRGAEPLMVHCSAGIGRTGVLITMETALTLMEKEEPVCPLQIIQSLRDQRAMMVQTSCQFTFVCEAILKIYKEKKVTAQ